MDNNFETLRIISDKLEPFVLHGLKRYADQKRISCETVVAAIFGVTLFRFHEHELVRVAVENQDYSSLLAFNPNVNFDAFLDIFPFKQKIETIRYMLEDIGSMLHQVDLTFKKKAQNDSLTVCYEQGEISVYYVDSFSAEFVGSLISCFKVMLQGVIDNDQVYLINLPVLTHDEWNQFLVNNNNTYQEFPQNKDVIVCFEEQVAKAPEAVALIFEDRRITVMHP